MKVPTRFRIYPYGPSKSALDLAEAIDGFIIKRVNSRYVPRRNDVIINWGCGTVPTEYPVKVNQPHAVRIAISKTRTYDALRRAGVTCPEWTRDLAVAQGWGRTGRVVGRDLDSGSAGAGITVYERGAVLGRHKFYVQYVRKQREFRFHVYKDRVLRILEKLKENGFINRDKYIRSHLRGWVFASQHLAEHPAPGVLAPLAISAVRSLGLDLGGVDIGWNDRSGGSVFEVNTAPGLEGSTIPAYANALLEDFV